MTFEQILTTLAGLLIAGLGFFLKSLHLDFKRIGDKLGDIATKVDVISTDLKGRTELLSQRMDYIEKEQGRDSKTK